MAATRPLISDGIYTIRAESSNTYLTADSTTGIVTADFWNKSEAQQWSIKSAGDGDYQLQSVGVRQNLGVNDQSQIVAAQSAITWTLEPRGHEAFVIGKAADTLAIQLPRAGPASSEQRWVVAPLTATVVKEISGFPVEQYFEIRAKGTNNVLLTYGASVEDGAQIQLWARPADKTTLRSAAFFIDRTGELVHAASGHNVDVVDNVLVIRARRPVYIDSNPWSHAPPRFSFRNSQIQIAFNHNPALPSTSAKIYPKDEWRNTAFVLARDSPVRPSLSLHPAADFTAWAPKVFFTPFAHYGTTINKDWGVVAEAQSGDVDPRTTWELVALNN
ncbi:hypothetical protein H0H93_014404 [Arthromyces matolae]|nr:hypothetical protein H0H93_014404 [Arthromyces matolae]